MNGFKVKIKLDGITFSNIENVFASIDTKTYEITNDIPCDISISSRGISILPDWNMQSVPLLYSQYIPLTTENLKTSIALRIENIEVLETQNFPENTIFSHNYSCIKSITNNALANTSIYDGYTENSQFEEYAIIHNKAVLSHYNLNKIGSDPEKTKDLFKHAVYLAPDSFWMAYTNFLYIVLLIELNEFEQAINIAYQINRRDVTPKIKVTTLLTIYKILTMSEMNGDFGNDIKNIETEIQPLLNDKAIAYDFYTAKSLYYESNQNLKEAQTTLDDALKNTEKDTYLYAKTQITKADLHIKMAQMGNYHHYTQSLQCYHEALKTTTKQNYPQEYANCQMNIGIIYAELPSVDNKKHIYAGLSQTAFSEALEIYNKFDQPYDYATVCTNFGNTMMRFLPSIDDERFDKIAYYFKEAIYIRETFELDEEKAVCLMSLLNLHYYRIESVEEVNFLWFEEMEIIAKEILQLTQNERFVAMAQDALEFVKHKN